MASKAHSIEFVEDSYQSSVFDFNSDTELQVASAATIQNFFKSSENFNNSLANWDFVQANCLSAVEHTEQADILSESESIIVMDYNSSCVKKQNSSATCSEKSKNVGYNCDNGEVLSPKKQKRCSSKKLQAAAAVSDCHINSDGSLTDESVKSVVHSFPYVRKRIYSATSNKKSKNIDSSIANSEVLPAKKQKRFNSNKLQVTVAMKKLSCHRSNQTSSDDTHADSDFVPDCASDVELHEKSDTLSESDSIKSIVHNLPLVSKGCYRSSEKSKESGNNVANNVVSAKKRNRFSSKKLQVASAMKKRSHCRSIQIGFDNSLADPRFFSGFCVRH